MAVQCLEDVTPELGLKYLDNFGFTTLAHGTEADTDADGNVWSDANLSTALGGVTHGVTNVELGAAFAAIANNGNYIKPVYYTKILDHDGNVLIENTSAERSVIKDSTAFLLTNAMEDVVRYGTGTACQLDNMPVAGKTGTTEAYNDLWFVGYTPYYTCTVWSGYDNNEKLPDYARSFHKNLWRRVMNRIHQGLEYKEFEQPSSIEMGSICAITGLLPGEYCQDIITEYFDVGSMPVDYCDQCYYEIPELSPTPTPEGQDLDGDGIPDTPPDGGQDHEGSWDGSENGENNGGDGNGDGSGDGSENGENNGGDDGEWDEGWEGDTGDYQVDYY